MRLSTPLLLAVLAGIGLTGCRTTTPGSGPRELAEIRIESYPMGWGYAHKTVKADGSITGGHVSGEEHAQRVFETKSELTFWDLSRLRELVASLPARPATAEPVRPDRRVEWYLSVVIVFRDDTTMTFFRKDGQRFQPHAVQAIWDTIYKYKVGAW